MIKIIGLELRKHVSMTGLIVILIFILLGLLINHTSIQKFRTEEITKKEFIKNETLKAKSCFTYNQYASSGFKLLFCPSAISSLYNSAAIPIIEASINASIRLDINTPKSSEHIFKGGINLSWFMITIGGMIVLCFGWGSFRNREYLKFLLNYASKLKVYAAVLIARLILLIFSLLLLTAFLFGQFYINGISLENSLIVYIIVFMAVAALVMIILLLLSSIMGTIKNASKGVIITFVSWFILLFLWPNLLHSIFSGKSMTNTKSIYQLELEKIKVLYEFEKMRINFVKDKADKRKAGREFTGNFLDDGKIEKLDIEIIEKAKKITNDFHFFSVFNPVTFYNSVGSEISSKGYNSYIGFLLASSQKKREFTKFHFDKLFEPGAIEPFLKGDEYIFYAAPSLPAYAWLGAAIQLSWIFLLLITGFFRFNSIVWASKKELEEVDFSKFAIDEDKPNIWYARNKNFKDALFTIFSRKEFEKLTAKQASIARGKKEFIYLCRPDEIPGDIKVKDFIGLYAVNEKKRALDHIGSDPLSGKTFEELSKFQRFSIFLSILKMGKEAVYLLDDIDLAIDINTLKLDEIINDLTKQGSIVILISRSASEVEIMSKNESIHIANNWFTKVGIIKEKMKWTGSKEPGKDRESSTGQG